MENKEEEEEVGEKELHKERHFPLFLSKIEFLDKLLELLNISPTGLLQGGDFKRVLRRRGRMGRSQRGGFQIGGIH